ncbi:MAG TPA: fasciclin domain-containing protein [Allosphingosinicella sp.]|nr:fasciclin domain-containing protein [Allosphingosinicella sp.]
MIKKAWCLALLAGGAAACDNSAAPGSTASNSVATANATAPAEARLASVISGDQQLGRLNRIVTGAGMTELLNGVGPYTLFAPTDAAIEGLGAERADALAGEAMRPQAGALLRAHIVPGTITRRDLEAAIGSAGGRPVRMRSMANTMLSFTREGDAIVISADEGGRARLTAQEGLASNGSVQPIDGLLVKAQ